jgi:peptide/nickel transport system substrate-binding protein
LFHEPDHLSTGSDPDDRKQTAVKSFCSIPVLVLVCALWGCGSNPQDSNINSSADRGRAASHPPKLAPAYGGMLIRGEPGDASVLLPILATDVPSTQVTDLIFSGLLKYDKDINLVGDLAEKWEIIDNQLGIRFHLRKDVRWHDGTPFTARDVEYTYRAYVDPKTPTPYASAFMKIKELRVLDSHTVELIYDRPYAPALNSWVYGKVLPRHLMEGTPVAESPLRRKPIGTGPYRFKEWKTGEKIVIEANPDYFGGRPYISRVLFRIVPDQATMFLELKAGKIDRMNLTPVQYERQTKTKWFRKNFKKYRFTDFGYVYLGYNLRDPRFKDKKVRQAITMAIDREGIVKGVFFGLAQVAYAPYKPDSFWYNPHVKKWPYNPKKARKMLAEVGWKDTDHDGILDKDGEPFAFTIITNQGNEARKNAAVLIQQNLRKVGIRAKIRIIEWAAFLKDFLDKRNFEAFMLGWINEKDPDATDQWNSEKTGPRQFNHTGFKNKRVDRLLELGVSTYDKQKRKKYYDEFQEILAEEQPVTFLWVIESLNTIHRRFHGIEPGPMGIDYNFEKWYVPASLRKYGLHP